MVYGMKNRIALRRKLHILRKLTKSKSVNKRSVVMDALFYIFKLKLKLEAARRDYIALKALKTGYLQQLNNMRQPKVEAKKFGEVFKIKVTSNRTENCLVSILEAFDKMGVNVVQARVSSNQVFNMEATVTQEGKDNMDEKDMTQALLQAMKY